MGKSILQTEKACYATGQSRCRDGQTTGLVVLPALGNGARGPLREGPRHRAGVGKTTIKRKRSRPPGARLGGKNYLEG